MVCPSFLSTPIRSSIFRWKWWYHSNLQQSTYLNLHFQTLCSNYWIFTLCRNMLSIFSFSQSLKLSYFLFISSDFSFFFECILHYGLWKFVHACRAFSIAYFFLACFGVHPSAMISYAFSCAKCLLLSLILINLWCKSFSVCCWDRMPFDVLFACYEFNNIFA